MNLEKLNNIITTVNVVGIKEIIIEKKSDGVVVRGADSIDDEHLPSVIIVSDVDDDVVDYTMGISRVPVLINRMKLFDLSNTKSTIVNNEDDEFVKTMTLKEHRKKVSFSLANPNTINVPSGTIQDTVNNNVILTKTYIQNLIKASQAMNSELMSISVINKEMVIELFDGVSDSFTDVIKENSLGECCEWEYHWQTNSVMKLLRQAIKSEDSVELAIGDLGMLYLTVDNLIFTVMPQVV